MSRQQSIARAVKAQPRTANGGTTAPRGPNNTTAVGGARKAYAPQAGIGGGKPAPAPGGAAAPAPSPYTPAPWDSQYEHAIGSARARYNNSEVGFGASRLGVEQEYGLAPGFNDYQSNPYSRAALLEQSYKQANRATTAGKAAAGQLYAGSTSNALSANRGSYGANRNSLDASYRAALNAITEKEVAAQNAKAGEEDEAGWKRIENAEKSPLEPETAPEKGKKGKGNKYGGGGKNKGNGRKEAVHQAVSRAHAVGGKKKR